MTTTPEPVPAVDAEVETLRVRYMLERFVAEYDPACGGCTMEAEDATIFAASVRTLLAALTASQAEAAALRVERDDARAEAAALKALICRVEPHVDAIVCYASTMGEHEPNRIAHEVRSVCTGPSQDELVGQRIAEQMIARIDAATAKPRVERGWLIELKGSVPSWAIVNPKDYDEHWTTDSARALRFARAADAQAYIDHIGWTAAFPSEHIWDDGARHDQ